MNSISQKNLKKKVSSAIENPTVIIEMKKNCISKAFEYSEEYVMAQIVERMGI